MNPTLFLIPAPLGEASFHSIFPAANKDIILQLRHFIVEEERTARRFLKAIDKNIDIDQLTFYPMGKHADESLFLSYLSPMQQGMSMGVISEAGCPAVADPGAHIVAIAQKMGFRVVPLVGPSSILMALMGSGFNGQSFAFNGYLPIDEKSRSALIKKLESRSLTENQTQIFIETPYRNHQIFNDLLKYCHPSTKLCIAAGITTKEEYIRTLTVQQWKTTTLPDLRKTPAIFLFFQSAPTKGHKR